MESNRLFKLFSSFVPIIIIAFLVSTFIGTLFGGLYETSTLEFPLNEILPRTALGGAFGTLGAAFALMRIDFLKKMKVQDNMDSKYEYFDDPNVAISIHYG